MKKTNLDVICETEKEEPSPSTIAARKDKFSANKADSNLTFSIAASNDHNITPSSIQSERNQYSYDKVINMPVPKRVLSGTMLNANQMIKNKYCDNNENIHSD